MTTPTSSTPDLETKNRIETWYNSPSFKELSEKSQPESRQQACITLHEYCSEASLKALCLTSRDQLYTRMRKSQAANLASNFTKDCLNAYFREGYVYKVLLQADYAFKDMPQSKSIGTKLWSAAQGEKKAIVDLWKIAFEQLDKDAKQVKPKHIENALERGKLLEQVKTSLDTTKRLTQERDDIIAQLQTQNQQVEEQLAVRVAARLAEEKKKLEDDYKKKLIEIRNTEDNLQGRILDLSDNCTELSEKKMEAEAKLADKNKEIEEKKKEAEAKLADKNKEIEEKKKEAEAMLADKNKEIEQLNKSLEEEKARSAIAISASEIFNTPTQDRRDSTTSTSSDITLVDSDITPSSGCGTKRSFHDLEEENKNMKQHIKNHKKCFREIDNAVHLAYCIEVGPDSEETLITSIETLSQYFKENKDLVDKKQPPKYEIKIHPNGKVMKDLAHWKSNTWSHLVWMVGEIEKSMEKRDL